MVKKLRGLMEANKGFTLMELLIVIAIIAILTVAFLPNALNAPKKARDAGRVKTLYNMQAALESIIATGKPLPNSVTNGTGGNAAAVGGVITTAFVEALGLGSTTITDITGSEYYYQVDADVTTKYWLIAKLDTQSAGNCGGCTETNVKTATFLDTAAADFVDNDAPSKYFVVSGPL